MTLVERLIEFVQAVGSDMKKLLPSTDPTMTYVDGKLSRVDYSDGSYKLFEYAGGLLVQVDSFKDGQHTRKVMVYNNGILTSVQDYVL